MSEIYPAFSTEEGEDAPPEFSRTGRELFGRVHYGAALDQLRDYRAELSRPLEGEHWLMHNGYTQAEGVANLDDVPGTGCLVAMGFPKFKGGTGGYARYVAICARDTPTGMTIGANDAPLPKSDKPLHWDTAAGTRVR